MVGTVILILDYKVYQAQDFIQLQIHIQNHQSIVILCNPSMDGVVIKVIGKILYKSYEEQ